MINNKKAIIPLALIIGGVILLIVLALIFLPMIVTALKGAESLTPKKPGCDSPIIIIEMSGVVIVKDGAIWGIEPEVDRIDDIGIRTSLFTIFEPFNYEIELFDRSNNVKLDSIKGTNKLPSDVKEIEIPFVMYYNTKDNDCNNLADNARLKIKIQIEETKDIFKDTETFEQDYTIRDGVLI